MLSSFYIRSICCILLCCFVRNKLIDNSRSWRYQLYAFQHDFQRRSQGGSIGLLVDIVVCTDITVCRYNLWFYCLHPTTTKSQTVTDGRTDRPKHLSYLSSALSPPLNEHLLVGNSQCLAEVCAAARVAHISDGTFNGEYVLRGCKTVDDIRVGGVANDTDACCLATDGECPSDWL